VRSGGNQARARNKTYFDAVEEEFSTLPWPTPTVRRAHPTNRRSGERDSFENGRVAMPFTSVIPAWFSGNPADSDGFLILMSAHSAGAKN